MSNRSYPGGAAVRVVVLLVAVSMIAPVAHASQDPSQSEAQARAALEEGRFQDAYAALRPALEAEPERSDLWFLLGQIVTGMGQPARALQAYDSSIGLNPEIASPWFARGIALLSLGNYTESVLSFEHFVEMVPGRPEVALYLGIARLRDGDPGGALRAFDMAEPGASDYGEVIRFRVEALRTLGEMTEAINAAGAYLEIDPEYQPVRFEMALAMAAAGRDAEAGEALRTAALAEPPSPAAIIEFGRVLRAAGTRAEQIAAAAAYRYGLVAFPADSTMLAELATLYVELDLDEDAGEAATQLIDRAPGNPEAMLMAGNILLRTRRPQEALKALELAVAAAPDEAFVVHHYGLALVEVQRFDEALEVFDRALAIDSTLTVARVEAARVALLMAQPERAVVLMEGAGDSIDNDAEGLALLGNAYVQTLRFADAITPLRRALDLDRGLTEAPYLLARAYRATGQEQAATDALAEFESRADQRAATQQAAGDPEAYRVEQLRTRAAVYNAERRFAEAIAVLESAIEIRNDDADLYDLLAAAYEGTGDTTQGAIMRQRADELRR